MKLFRKLRALFHKGKLDADMAEEMRAHLELQTKENIARGMTADEARYAARRQFGGIDQLKEQIREIRSWPWLENGLRDLCLALRALRRAPAFGLAVIATLALCIGANTAIFSAIQSLILKPLPFRDPDQLVEIYNSLPKAGVLKIPVSVAQYVDYKSNADRFESFALLQAWAFNLGGENYPIRAAGAKVTADFFQLLDLSPVVGRFPSMEECVAGKDHVLVLTQTFWETRFGGDPAIVGKEIRVSGELFTVIGVAPRRLEAINRTLAALKPFEMTPLQADPKARSQWVATLYARLKRGVSLSLASAQLATLENRFWATLASPDDLNIRDQGGQRIAVGEIRAEQMTGIKSGLLLLQGAAGLVLLMGVVNVANLMTARVNARRMEFAIRCALGAGQRALISQMLAESALLVALGATIGVGGAWASLHILDVYKTAILHDAPPIVMDATVLGVTLTIAVVATLAVGLWPILRVDRTAPSTPSPGESGGLGVYRRVHGVLVTSQVALASILLIGTSLLIQSYAHVQAIQPGFDAQRIVHARIALDATYQNQSNLKAARDRIVAAMGEIPGVLSVATISGDPVEGQFAPHAVTVRSDTAGAVSKSVPTTNLIEVSPNFFATMGIQIIAGRGFIEADKTASSRRYIIDRNFAEKYFPGREAVEERFERPGPPEQWPVIVGVAEVARFLGADDRSGRPFVYAVSARASTVFSLVLRTERSTYDLAPLMREKLRAIDPALPLEAVTTFEAILDHFVATRRGIMELLGAFALIALGLAAVGIFGMLAYDVSRRTREIAIRGAIGATPRQIMTLILSQGMTKAGVGSVLGFMGALYFTRFMQSLLFEVRPWDPWAYFSVLWVLLSVALLACWLPARRAAKVDPMVALRCE